MTSKLDRRYSALVEDRIMKELHSKGKTTDEIPECLKCAPIRPRIVAAIKSAYALGQNAICLEEKEKIEKEMLSQIINEANYKADFYRMRLIACDNNKAANREKEKLFLANQEKFHAEGDKNYLKVIVELLPNEVPTIEKKDQEKKPSIVVIQGPKPGKSTNLSRLWQILSKLKHNTPPHLKPPPPPAPATSKDAKTGGPAVAATAPKAAAVAATPEAVAAA